MKKLLIIAILLVTTQVNAKIEIVPDNKYYNYDRVWALMDIAEKFFDEKDYRNSCLIYKEMEHIVDVIVDTADNISGTEIQIQDRIQKIKVIACGKVKDKPEVNYMPDVGIDV